MGKLLMEIFTVWQAGYNGSMGRYMFVSSHTPVSSPTSAWVISSIIRRYVFWLLTTHTQ